MATTPPAYWDLADLAGNSEIAEEYGVAKSTVVNWSTRYADFPKPLIPLSTGPVYSRWMVRQWHDARDWGHGRPRRQRDD